MQVLLISLQHITRGSLCKMDPKQNGILVVAEKECFIGRRFI